MFYPCTYIMQHCCIGGKVYSTKIAYTYFPNSILNTTIALIFIYCGYKSTVATFNTLHGHK